MKIRYMVVSYIRSLLSTTFSYAQDTSGDDPIVPVSFKPSAKTSFSKAKRTLMSIYLDHDKAENWNFLYV